jgi:oxygen-independent coproporphyrinogen-3 oxidase
VKGVQKIGIYLHIPFCWRACFYCHFCKQAYDRDLVERYVDALVKEIRLRASRDNLVDSLYLGGGSPSLLQERQVAAITQAVEENFKLDRSLEYTMEMNPEDISPAQLRYLKEIGVNRLSIGTQSFIQADLDYLKRTHQVHHSRQAVEYALEAGFSNLNLDFIISLPGQTRESLKDNFSILSAVDIPHVSAYLLEEVEESEEKYARDHDLYFFTREFLCCRGYTHYEVSNFSKPGFQSRHNRKYWENKSYIGAGLSASGYENGVDYKNTTDFNDYFEKIAHRQLPQEEENRPDLGVRRIVMGLRLLKGIPAVYFKKYREPSDFLLSGGFLIHNGKRIAVNPGKILLLNEILTYF